ncbi:MAG: 2-nitropropane dioxygenase-like protein [Rhodospirillaceae bacterium]|nr:MAG: 2-nitropropane dioxygenase-like protein [Rhodospirillaceae bacterium]
MKSLKPMVISGREVLPLVEGGKGISVSSGTSTGAWAAAGGVGTFSGVNAGFCDENGTRREIVYRGKTRHDRHEELIAYAIEGGINQARIAYQISGGEGRLHMNVLWEMGGCERILHGILEGAKGLIHGVTCGAGMPYRVADICTAFGVHYYPIVSSARAFRALWKRSYHKRRNFLGGVVYEDPWLAGGHNGLSNVEDPQRPQDPYPRVLELRQTMREVGLAHIPVFMAGGVWCLREWEEWIDSPELGPIAFQFGTRPLLTRESPIPDPWKRRLLTLQKGDVLLHRFSPTGFYSSAVHNAFLQELVERSARQIAYASEPTEACSVPLGIGARGRMVYVAPDDRHKAGTWLAEGLTETLRTPEATLIFISPARAEEILHDQTTCMGCLSACQFSNWAQNETGTTGKRADPRSFCIQKTLQNIIHGADIDRELMFAGHNVYRFAMDPFYSNSFVPTVRQLVDRLLTGE